MGLQVMSEVTQGIAKITLIGEVDSASAGMFKDEVDKVALQSPKEIVFFMKDLNFMSSAGLRVIVFTKQKLGAEVPIYIVNPQEGIVDTLQKTGLHHSVFIVDSYPVKT
jgi:anti-anti-sigma factor